MVADFLSATKICQRVGDRQQLGEGGIIIYDSIESIIEGYRAASASTNTGNDSIKGENHEI